MSSSDLTSNSLPSLRRSDLLSYLLLAATASAIVSQYISQAAMLVVVAFCAVVVFKGSRWYSPSGAKPSDEYAKASATLDIPWSWIAAFSLVSIVSLPMVFSSDSARPLDSPLRYTILILPLLVLPRFELAVLPILRCISAAAVVACGLVLTFDLYADTRFKFIDETRYDFGLGLLDSAFAATFFVPLVLAQIYLDRRRWPWLLLGLASLFTSAVIIVMSGTRASWLSVLVAPIFTAVLLAPKSRRLILGSVLIASILIACSYLFAPMVKERVDAAAMNLHQYYTLDEIGHRNSLGLRLDLWKAALETFSRYPLNGPSYQQRAAVKQEMIGQGLVSEHIGTDGKGSAHNELLNAMSQKGLFGLFALLLLYLVPGATFFKGRRSANNETSRVLSIAGLGSVIAVALCGLAEAPLMSGRFAILYGFVLVLIFSMLRQQQFKTGASATH